MTHAPRLYVNHDVPTPAQQRLYDAVDAGRAADIREMVRGGHVGSDVILDAVDPGGNTCLGRAVQIGHVDIVRILLQAGADVNKSDFYGQTALQYTAETNDVTIATMLISAGADVDWNTDGLSALHIAACKGHTDIIRLLLESGANPSAKDINDVSVLHCAVGNGHAEIVRLLLAAKADINVTGGISHRTPLFMAVDVDDEQLVEFLLQSGAKYNTQDDFGLTPLCGACRQNYGGIARKLVGARARVNVADDDGSLPLHYAARNGDLGLVKVLIQAGSNINLINCHHLSPLHLAVRNAHVDTIRLLVDRGADTNLRHPDDNRSCIHVAVDAIGEPAIFESVLQILVGGGASLDILSGGSTALWRAIAEQKEQAAILLVQYGANINVEGPHGITVLQRACCLGLETLVNTLLHAGIQWSSEAWLSVDAYSTAISPDLLAGYIPGVPMALHNKLPLLCAISSVRGATLSLQHLARLTLRGAARGAIYRLSGTPRVPPTLRDFVLLKVL